MQLVSRLLIQSYSNPRLRTNSLGNLRWTCVRTVKNIAQGPGTKDAVDLDRAPHLSGDRYGRLLLPTLILGYGV